jgi:hypothetical protein
MEALEENKGEIENIENSKLYEFSRDLIINSRKRGKSI